MINEIRIKGARVNNLKNISLNIPKDKLVVITGLSGSGKSSLAFDTIFAEGQRRYIESLSSYARQFLGQMDKPDVDLIEGLSPSISIDQKTTSKNPRSTVGTVTEIYDHLRLLFAKMGVPHCPNCGREIKHQTVDQIADIVMNNPEGTKVRILAPIARGKKGEYKKELESYKKKGYARLIIDGVDYTFDEEINLDKNIKHTISIVVDRLIVKDGIQRRLTDSLENALNLTEGLVEIDTNGDIQLLSTKYACPDCGISIEELEPRTFSFNSPFGACPTCTGLGYTNDIDLTKLIQWDKTIHEGALNARGYLMEICNIPWALYVELSKKLNFSLDVPVREIPKEKLDKILYGIDGKLDIAINTGKLQGSISRKYPGVVPTLMKRYRETTSEFIKTSLDKYMKLVPCDACQGKRLKKEALAVTVKGLNIADMCSMSVDKLLAFFKGLELKGAEAIIGAQIVKEIVARLNFLKNVGLGYLTLDRASSTLSGGESQRIRLATQIGSGLTGVLYILDEPSIGLHQSDNDKLLNALENLRDLGNTLIVVEHDEDTMRRADWIIDIGPGAGIHGGKVVAQGTAEDLEKCEKSITGQYLAGKIVIPVPQERKKPTNGFITIKGAKKNNLKNVDVSIPLGLFNVITGVSGSGKSSLINETLNISATNYLNGVHDAFDYCDTIEGLDQIDKVIDIDQQPIGRTPRSNPATYTGVFTAIRTLFSQTPDAKARGYAPGRFSFNISGGRCENCEGDGIIKIEMNFLNDVYVPCEVCHGKRYNRETLEVKYKGKSIYDVLDMTITEACEFFKNHPQIYNKIKTLQDVGLGYIKLGQSATTLSGGEAQRVKLATELSKKSTGKTLYILDEPTTGLHAADVQKLVKILQRLVDAGNTVVVIEHNLDVIKVADNIIDLGPEGGDKGGQIIAQGTPEDVAKVKDSKTGIYLKKILK
ncbi:MAG: excinuclease ABC subunit UvrA [Clostridia bacterium]|nr:excinuclease ABC subunit UvrA [Clostridia bacterium]